MAQQRSSYTWNGKAISQEMRKAAVVGLTKWAELVLQKARSIVPLDEATLERSGVASVDPAELSAAVSFDTPYAVVQHEDLTLTHAPGREAKYLEKPLVASRPLAGPMIAKEIKKVTGA